MSTSVPSLFDDTHLDEVLAFTPPGPFRVYRPTNTNRNSLWVAARSPEEAAAHFVARGHAQRVENVRRCEDVTDTLLASPNHAKPLAALLPTLTEPVRMCWDIATRRWLTETSDA